MDKWSLLRLYSIQNNISNNFEVLKSDLLRYGSLIKTNLPKPYSDCIIDVDYDFRKMVRPCIIIYVDKTISDIIISSDEYIKLLEELVGDFIVSIYDEDKTILIIDIMI